MLLRRYHRLKTADEHTRTTSEETAPRGAVRTRGGAAAKRRAMRRRTNQRGTEDRGSPSLTIPRREKEAKVSSGRERNSRCSKTLLTYRAHLRQAYTSPYLPGIVLEYGDCRCLHKRILLSGQSSERSSFPSRITPCFFISSMLPWSRGGCGRVYFESPCGGRLQGRSVCQKQIADPGFPSGWGHMTSGRHRPDSKRDPIRPHWSSGSAACDSISVSAGRYRTGPSLCPLSRIGSPLESSREPRRGGSLLQWVGTTAFSRIPAGAN
jgi:hypothetical protein